MVPRLFESFAFILTLLVVSSWAEVGVVQLMAVVWEENAFLILFIELKCLPATELCFWHKLHFLSGFRGMLLVGQPSRMKLSYLGFQVLRPITVLLPSVQN